MLPFCYINGQFVAQEVAQIGIHDLGLLRGYGIFDYFRFRDEIPVFIEDHLDRFYQSADRTKLEVPMERSVLLSVILELAERNAAQNAGLQMLLTGGYSPDGFSYVSPNLLLLMRNFQAPCDSFYTGGIRIITHAFQREMPSVKTTNYMRPILLRMQLKAANAGDVLYHHNRKVSESSRSNFFIVTQNGTLVTPANGVLKGITRKQVLQLAETETRVEERDLYLDEVWAAKEAFLTSSNKGVMPVVQIDDRSIGKGKPGSTTLALQELFMTHIEKKKQAFLKV